MVTFWNRFFQGAIVSLATLVVGGTVSSKILSSFGPQKVAESLVKIVAPAAVIAGIGWSLSSFASAPISVILNIAGEIFSPIIGSLFSGFFLEKLSRGAAEGLKDNFISPVAEAPKVSPTPTPSTKPTYTTPTKPQTPPGYPYQAFIDKLRDTKVNPPKPSTTSGLNAEQYSQTVSPVKEEHIEQYIQAKSKPILGIEEAPFNPDDGKDNSGEITPDDLFSTVLDSVFPGRDVYPETEGTSKKWQHFVKKRNLTDEEKRLELERNAELEKQGHIVKYYSDNPPLDDDED